MVDVCVQYAITEALAKGFGVQPNDVEQVISEDNAERHVLSQQTGPESQLLIEPAEDQEQDAPIYGTEPDRFFDPCSEDELGDETEGEGQDI